MGCRVFNSRLAYLAVERRLLSPFGARLVRVTVNAFQLFRSIGDPSLVLVGEAGGLGLLRFEAGAPRS